MDLVRSCYTTEMAFDKAGTVKAKVKWFFALPGAQVFPGVHNFTSNNWEYVSRQRIAFPGETEEKTKWSNGAVPGPLIGNHVCGPLDWFRNGSPPGAPALRRDAFGLALCCIDPTFLDGRGRSCSIGGYSLVPQPPFLGSGCSCSAGYGTLVTTSFIGSGCSCSAGDGALAVTVPLTGSGCSCSTGSGVLAVTVPLTGSGCSCSTGSGVLAVTVPLTGSGCSCSTGSGVLAVTVPLTGSGCSCGDGNGFYSLAPWPQGSGCSCSGV